MVINHIIQNNMVKRIIIKLYKAFALVILYITIKYVSCTKTSEICNLIFTNNYKNEIIYSYILLQYNISY
jgi:hypothetical protein